MTNDYLLLIVQIVGLNTLHRISMFRRYLFINLHACDISLIVDCKYVA
jgi:hypothetical protein